MILPHYALGHNVLLSLLMFTAINTLNETKFEQVNKERMVLISTWMKFSIIDNIVVFVNEFVMRFV